MTTIPAPGADLATERALFEAAMNAARFFPAELNFARRKSPGGRDEYVNSHLQSCWVGWQSRATIAAVPASEPVALTEHDLGIIRDIEAMAATPIENWWSQALALGASGLIKRLSAAPAPVSERPMGPGHYEYIEQICDAFQSGKDQALMALPFANPHFYRKTPDLHAAHEIGHLAGAADPVSGMPDLASLPQYGPSMEPYFHHYKATMVGDTKGGFVKLTDVERLFAPDTPNPAGETK